MTSPKPRLLAAAALLALLAGCGDAEPPAAAPTAPVETQAPATSAPLYTIAKTWSADGGMGAGVTLVVSSESQAQSEAAITGYLRDNPPEGDYLYVEVLGHADATTWTCAGEWVGAESGLKFAVFDLTKAFVNFPADWTECQ